MRVTEVGVGEMRSFQICALQMRIPKSRAWESSEAQVWRGGSINPGTHQDGQHNLHIGTLLCEVLPGVGGAVGCTGPQRCMVPYIRREDFHNRAVVPPGFPRQPIERVDPTNAHIKHLTAELIDRPGEPL